MKANGNNTDNADSEYTDSIVYTKVKTLLSKYLADGKFIKYTNINIDSTKEDIKKDFNSLFHNSVTDLNRITYYDDNSLWMTNESGNINSGYGTDENGNMTHFVRNLETGLDVIDYRVDKSHPNWNDQNEDGMEGFYVTPNDFLHDNYSFDGWKLTESNKYVFNSRAWKSG